ncbi:MAG: DUF4372 domain-containing protein [Prevotella sp.]|nr:DUF4372 domain-containing protein [Prevotella sp.]
MLNQVVNLMSMDKIIILAGEKGTNRYTKHLDSYTHLIIMLYAVLTNSSSLREVVLGFESHVSCIGIWAWTTLSVEARLPTRTRGAPRLSSRRSTTACTDFTGQ